MSSSQGISSQRSFAAWDVRPWEGLRGEFILLHVATRDTSH
jgi:hypothetical protein